MLEELDELFGLYIISPDFKHGKRRVAIPALMNKEIKLFVLVHNWNFVSD